eukprot:scaffold845_cov231-Pinguiococcus_pyrenoidosus.AAC.11
MLHRVEHGLFRLSASAARSAIGGKMPLLALRTVRPGVVQYKHCNATREMSAILCSTPTIRGKSFASDLCVVRLRIFRHSGASTTISCLAMLTCSTRWSSIEMCIK